jgi:hypothetical protein
MNYEIKHKYFQLKKKRDAAYTVFKKTPTVENASKHTIAAQAFTNFCIETMAALVEDTGDPDKREEILANIEDYKTCKQCGSEVLYQVDNRGYIASSDFLEDFPGWCYTCLVEHCCAQDCSTCTLVADPSKCSFKEVKNSYLQEV